MKFKVGDLIEGTSKSEYGVTCKGNGYGKVICVALEEEEKESSVDDIRVLWLEEGETNFLDANDYSVNSKYFKLKSRRWRDELD